MTTLALDFTVQSRHGLRWSDVKRRLAIWWQYSCSRSEHEGLSDKCLQDIGISRREAELKRQNHFG